MSGPVYVSVPAAGIQVSAGPEKPGPAEFFEQMAERIRRNVSGEFGGALLLIPPGDEQPIEILIVDPRPGMELFLSTAEAQIAAAKADWLQRSQGNVPMHGAGRRFG